MLGEEEKGGGEDGGCCGYVECVVGVAAGTDYVTLYSLPVIITAIVVVVDPFPGSTRERGSGRAYQSAVILALWLPALGNDGFETGQVNAGGVAAHGSGGLGEHIRATVPSREVQGRQQ